MEVENQTLLYSSEPTILFNNDDIIPNFNNPMIEADKIEDSIFYLDLDHDNFNLYLVNNEEVVCCKSEPELQHHPSTSASLATEHAFHGNIQHRDSDNDSEFLMDDQADMKYFNSEGDHPFDDCPSPVAVRQESIAKKLPVIKPVKSSGGGPTKKHICKECSKSFTTKQKMFRHMWIHRKTKFSCEICPSNFESPTLLHAHRLSNHFENSPFVCSLCGKNFSSRQGLWEHKRFHHSHTTISQFHCDDCDKSFSSRQGYLIHRRIHTDERPYSCLFCIKSFRDGGTLRKHQRIHTGERPHKCPLCDKDFNQKVVLREHIRWLHAAHNKEITDQLPEPMKCLLCDLQIDDREEMCAHYIKHGDQIAAYKKDKNPLESFEAIAELKQTQQNPGKSKSAVSSELIRRNKLILKKINVKVKCETVQKPKFVCVICQQQFKTRNLLQKHKKCKSAV